MKSLLLCVLFAGFALAPAAAQTQAQPQSDPQAFPLAGDWQGDLEKNGAVLHLLLHMSTTREGKMTALLDYPDGDVYGIPAIGGSFDGTKLKLRFFEWKPDHPGGTHLLYFTFSYEASISASGAEMAGTLDQDGTWPLRFKRLTWQAKIPKPAPPTPVDGDWAGIEYGGDMELHFVFHISNTEDGLQAYLDCTEEKFKGALAHKATYDEATRQITINFGKAVYSGKLSADGTALDTTLTEPGFQFAIHFARVPPKQAPSL